MRTAILLSLCVLLCLPLFAGCGNITIYDRTAGSQGLEYASYGDGTCEVIGMGSCTDIHVVIPKSSPDGDRVVAIGVSAFGGCTTLERVTIPEGVVTIGDQAFIGCHFLREVEFPESLVYIGPYAFYKCQSLYELYIPGVRDIGDAAFMGCFSLTDVVIGEGTENIGYNAFESCESLRRISIPASVTQMGDFALAYNEKLNRVEFGGTMDHWWGMTPYTVISYTAEIFCQDGIILMEGEYGEARPETAPDIWYPSDDPTEETRVEETPEYYGPFFADIGAGYSSVAGYSFYPGEMVAHIPDASPDGYEVRAVEPYAFSGCHDLGEIQLPDSVRSIGENAFSYCRNLAVFRTPQELAEIEPYAFAECVSLDGIKLGDSLVSIGEYAFLGCTALRSVDIPDSVQYLRDGAFQGCSSLDYVRMSGSAPCIPAKFFADCRALDKIEITSSIEIIGESAFANCNSLREIQFNGTMEEWLSIQIDPDNEALYNAFVSCNDGLLEAGWH